MTKKISFDELAVSSWNFARDGQLDRAAKLLMEARSEQARLNERYSLSSEDFEEVFVDAIFRFLDEARSIATGTVDFRKPSPGPLFRSLVYQLTLDRVLSLKRRTPEEAPRLGFADDFDRYVGEALPDQAVLYEQRERADALYEALDRFRAANPDAYGVIVLQMEGWSTEEIADHLGVSYANAKDRILRARRKFREFFEGNLRREKPSTTAVVSAYSKALELGAIFRRQVLDSDELLPYVQARTLIGGATPTQAERDGPQSTIAVVAQDGGGRYPQWQFEDGVREHIHRVLEALACDGDAWGEYLFFTQANPNLDGQTPLEALRQGQVDAVVGAATAFSESDSNG